MAKEMANKKVLGGVEVFVDLNDEALVKALKGEPGKKGDPGPNVKGDPGRDSDKAGPPGRAPYAEEIDLAVHKYLKGKDLQGKPGDSIKGDPGPEVTDERIKALIREILAERFGG